MQCCSTSLQGLASLPAVLQSRSAAAKPIGLKQTRSSTSCVHSIARAKPWTLGRKPVGNQGPVDPDQPEELRQDLSDVIDYFVNAAEALCIACAVAAQAYSFFNRPAGELLQHKQQGTTSGPSAGTEASRGQDTQKHQYQLINQCPQPLLPRLSPHLLASATVWSLIISIGCEFLSRLRKDSRQRRTRPGLEASARLARLEVIQDRGTEKLSAAERQLDKLQVRVRGLSQDVKAPLRQVQAESANQAETAVKLAARLQEHEEEIRDTQELLAALQGVSAKQLKLLQQAISSWNAQQAASAAGPRPKAAPMAHTQEDGPAQTPVQAASQEPAAATANKTADPWTAPKVAATRKPWSVSGWVDNPLAPVADARPPRADDTAKPCATPIQHAVRHAAAAEAPTQPPVLPKPLACASGSHTAFLKASVKIQPGRPHAPASSQPQTGGGGLEGCTSGWFAPSSLSDVERPSRGSGSGAPQQDGAGLTTRLGLPELRSVSAAEHDGSLMWHEPSCSGATSSSVRRPVEPSVEVAPQELGTSQQQLQAEQRDAGLACPCAQAKEQSHGRPEALHGPPCAADSHVPEVQNHACSKSTACSERPVAEPAATKGGDARPITTKGCRYVQDGQHDVQSECCSAADDAADIVFMGEVLQRHWHGASVSVSSDNIYLLFRFH